MKKFLLAALATMILGTSAAFAQVVVRIAPPPPIVEHRPVRPGAAYIWIGGHHRWDGRHYVWAPGRWAVPPHRGGVWVEGHWRHHRGGWVWAPGHWRYHHRRR